MNEFIASEIRLLIDRHIEEQRALKEQLDLLGEHIMTIREKGLDKEYPEEYQQFLETQERLVDWAARLDSQILDAKNRLRAMGF
jgi:hypothetical protein